MTILHSGDQHTMMHSENRAIGGQDLSVLFEGNKNVSLNITYLSDRAATHRIHILADGEVAVTDIAANTFRQISNPVLANDILTNWNTAKTNGVMSDTQYNALEKTIGTALDVIVTAPATKENALNNKPAWEHAAAAAAASLTTLPMRHADAAPAQAVPDGNSTEIART